jgi:hypothetical protein
MIPKKPAISVRGETYNNLKREAEKLGISVSVLAEKLLTKSFPKSK